MTITVFVLSILCIIAGQSPGYLQNYEVLYINVTGLKAAYLANTTEILPIHDFYNVHLSTHCAGYYHDGLNPPLVNVSCSRASSYGTSPFIPDPSLRKQANNSSKIPPLLSYSQRPPLCLLKRHPQIPLLPSRNPKRLHFNLQPPTARLLHILRHVPHLDRHRAYFRPLRIYRGQSRSWSLALHVIRFNMSVDQQRHFDGSATQGYCDDQHLWARCGNWRGKWNGCYGWIWKRTLGVELDGDGGSVLSSVTWVLAAIVSGLFRG
jgi:hypothetical protein